MPMMKNRKGATHGALPNTQINRGAAQGGNGVQKFDGRAMTNRGTQNSPVPKTLEGKQVYVGNPSTTVNK